MTNDEMLEVLQDMHYDGFGNFRPDYSGRYMYTRICPGLVTGEPIKAIEEAARRGLGGAVIDSMGMDSIVYYPDIRGRERPEEDEEETEDE